MNRAFEAASLEQWLVLDLAPGLGCRSAHALIETLGSAAAVCTASHSQLQAAGLEKETVEAIRNPDRAYIDQALAWHDRPGQIILTPDSESYPRKLTAINDPPLTLYVRGDPQVLDLPQLAVVGSRSPTKGGIENAREFSRVLVENGIVVTSGLAAGIDGAAHAGALDAGGPTIAVCGTGVDRVYPSHHKRLAERILEQGAIISEYRLGFRPMPQNFPRRNRIISGLSLGVLVVEAAVRSGSLITARMASEQGRDVFAIPGSIHSPLARGCHSLIRDGATLVESVADILAELQYSIGNAQSTQTLPGKTADIFSSQYDEEYHQLVTAMGYDPVSVDVLVGRTGLTPDAICSMLLILEMDGVISSIPGGNYQRTG